MLREDKRGIDFMSVASSRRRRTRGLVAAVVLVLPVRAGADEASKVPPWRLVYEPNPNIAASCPDKRYVRAAVAADIGYDPFTEDAPRSISMTVVQAPKQLKAHIEARDESGKIVDKQTAWAPSWRCDMLVDRAAVFLVEIVETAARQPAQRQAPSAPFSPPPTSPAAAAPPAPPSVAPSTVQRPARPAPVRDAEVRSPWLPKLAFFAGGGPTFWPAPETALSFTMSGEARWTRFSLGAQGRYDLAWSLPTKQVAHGYLLGGAALACGYYEFGASSGYLRGCILGGLSRLSTSVEGLTIKDGEATVVDIGARVGVGYWLHGPLGVELQVDALYLPHRPAVQIDQTEAWRLPGANIAIRAGVTGLFDILGPGGSR